MDIYTIREEDMNSIPEEEESCDISSAGNIGSDLENESIQESLSTSGASSDQTINTTFPSLVKWRDAKLRDMCYCTAIFFNYLAEPRMGYSPVAVSTKLDVSAVKPEITLDMTNYVIGDIFPCPYFLKEGIFRTYRAPLDLANAIEATIRDNLSKPFRKLKKKGGILMPGVVQSIWMYLSNGMDLLAFGEASNEQVAEKIAASEAATISKRNCSMNYGFNDDVENCAFQTILYILVALVDWLEYDEITETEVVTAYKIITPPDLQHKLKKTKNKRFVDIITPAIVSRNLTPTKKAIELISTMMLEVGEYMNNMHGNKNSARIISRYMGLCRPV
jgi:hypothetical protein